ncbi:MAG: MFS transporter [Candidatus Sumerlaeia bacterium]|nr:MFS transporter [Candidatus Sumerlaeia bacterium]
MAELMLSDQGAPRERMTGYHWWVLAVGSMSWLFDCMDARLFALSRQPALTQLLAPVTAGMAPADAGLTVLKFGDVATAAMMVGWAVGGLFFGIVGDKWGRVRTLSTSILVYSSFTGLSGLSQTWVDFCVWRFLMGCGIGGAFATAATLIAETLPAHVRALALGSFQALSALGNILGSAVSAWVIPPNQPVNFLGLGWHVPGWRLIFGFGVLPAFLIFLIMRTIREPEQWHQARRTAKAQLDRQMGDLKSMMTHPRWRRAAIVGVLLAVAGAVGLWGVGFYTPELISEALKGATPKQENFVRGFGLMIQDCGALVGIFFYTFLALWMGRRAAFGICFVLAYAVVTFVFLNLNSARDAFWMTPMVGFVTLSVFGGYSIYFPEIFPTRLRATGTAICYNVARILTAAIIFMQVPMKGFFNNLFADQSHPVTKFFVSIGAPTPFRAVAVVMCLIYFVGLITLFWAPETKGKPLPTDEN